MSPEKQEELLSLFPRLFRDRTSLSGGNGWYPIILRCLGQIDGASKQAGLEEERYPVVVQIKEKFGAARLYCERGPEVIDDFIQELEETSLSTCEDCGVRKDQDPSISSEVISEKRQWLKTLCKPCREKRTKER